MVSMSALGNGSYKEIAGGSFNAIAQPSYRRQIARTSGRLFAVVGNLTAGWGLRRRTRQYAPRASNTAVTVRARM